MKNYLLIVSILLISLDLYAVRESQGFPAKIIGVPVFQMPVIGNIDSDEENEILFYASGRLECWKSDGSICSWAPYEIKENVEMPFSPALVDINNDGKSEVVFGSMDGNLFIMNGDGKILPNFPKKFANGYISTPSAFDLDGDSKPEICFGTQDKKFYCIKPDGTAIKGFPVKTDSPITTSGSFAYFGPNNELSIAFGCENGEVYVVNAKGRVLPNFPFKTHYQVTGMPVFADINDDGKNELIIASQDYNIYALNEKGKLLPNFPFETGYRIHSSPAIADIDMDGYLDIIVTSTDGKLYVIDYNGKPKSGFPFDTGSKIFSSPVVGDVNCDGLPEIVFAAVDGRAYVVTNKGKPIEDFPYIIGGEVKSSPIISDIDQDNRVEMLFLTPKSELHSLIAVNKCEKKSKIVWQMAGRDSQKSGRFFPNMARIYDVGFESTKVYANESIKAKYRYFHLDGRAEQNTKIFWYKNGKRVEELDGKKVLEPKYFKKHDKIYFEVQDEENFKEYGRGAGSKIAKSEEIEIRNVIPEAPQIEFTPKDVFTNTKVEVKIAKDSTDYDNDKIIYRYSYFKNNRKLEYPDNQNFINPSDVFKNDRFSIIVTPFDGEETGKSASLEFVVKNTAPSVCDFEIVPSNPTVTSEIEIKITRQSTDIDKDSLNYVYNLWLDGVFIPYNFSNNKFMSNFFKKNQEVKVGVRSFDGELYSQEVYKTVRIFNSPPSAPEIVILPQNPTVESELKAIIKKPSLDYDRDAINYKFVWFRNSEPIKDAREGVLAPSFFKKGDIIKVEVTPNDGVVDGSKGSAEIKIINARPSNVVAHLAKTVLVSTDEATIVIDRESKDPDGDSISYKTEWFNSNKRIEALNDRLNSKGFALRKHDRWDIKMYASDGVDRSDAINMSFEVKNTPPTRPEIAFEAAPVDRNNSLRVKVVKPSQDIDGDKVEYKIKWFVNGKEVEQVRDRSELRPEFFNKNQSVVVRVTPFDGEEVGESVETTTYIKNATPTAPVVDIEPKNPSVSSDITCKVTKQPVDIDGDVLISKFNWYKNSVLFLSGVENRLDKGFLKKGDKISCEMVSTDGEYVVNHRSAEVLVVNSRPTKPELKILPENPSTRDELDCVIVRNSEDADSDKLIYHFEWKKNDKNYKENTGKLSSEEVLRGNKYTCSVYSSDGESKSDVSEVSVNIKNKRPAAPSVKLEPAYPFEGDELQCKIIKPSVDIEGDEVKYKFFWYKNGQVMNFATTSASMPGRLVKKGEIYNCEVVPYDFEGDGEKGYSNSVIILERK